MADYDNTNRFVLFKNESKKTDKHPDMSGGINIEGVEHFFDAWAAVENGRLVRISGKIGNAKTKQPEQGNTSTSGPRDAPQLARADDVPFDDDLPF